MGRKSNCNLDNPGFKKKDAYQTLTLINAWTGNIDAKSSFALALDGVLIGEIFRMGLPSAFRRITDVISQTELHGIDIFAVVLVGMLYCASLSSTIFFICAIKARVKKSTSLFFFKSIGEMELQSYKDNTNSATKQELIEDLEEQIHTNSEICNQKVKLYNWGIRFLLGTVVLWFVCMAFRII